MENFTPDVDQNQKDLTGILKDGMIEPFVNKDADGREFIDYRLNSKSAYWKTHNINHAGFGLLAEAIEYLAVLARDTVYNMSIARGILIRDQINSLVNEVLKLSIDAKSSETMRDGRNAQTSLVDKYLKNKQERILEMRGDKVKSSMFDAIRGKQAEDNSD